MAVGRCARAARFCLLPGSPSLSSLIHQLGDESSPTRRMPGRPESRIAPEKSAWRREWAESWPVDEKRPNRGCAWGRNRDQPWSYRYYEITLSCTAGFRAQLAFRVGGDLGVGRLSIYTDRKSPR